MGKKLADGSWKDSCLEKVAPGEPIFVLRGQDQSSPALVQLWISMNPQISEEKRQDAQRTLQAMNEWPKKKRAD